MELSVDCVSTKKLYFTLLKYLIDLKMHEIKISKEIVGKVEEFKKSHRCNFK